MFIIHRILFSASQKVRIVKKTPPQNTINWQKILPAKFLIPPNTRRDLLPTFYCYLEDPETGVMGHNFAKEIFYWIVGI